MSLDDTERISCYLKAKEFAKSLDSDVFPEFAYYGIRGQNHTFEPVGSVMKHKSVMWFDDYEDSSDGEELDGVCAIDIFDIPNDILIGRGVYPFEHFAILGSNCADVGYDDGEIILHDPVVIKILC